MGADLLTTVYIDSTDRFLIPNTLSLKQKKDIGTGPELNISWHDIGTGHERHPSTVSGRAKNTKTIRRWAQIC